MNCFVEAFDNCLLFFSITYITWLQKIIANVYSFILLYLYEYAFWTKFVKKIDTLWQLLLFYLQLIIVNGSTQYCSNLF